MTRLLALVYGVVVYLLFGLTWVYFVGFLGGFPVWKDVDAGAIAPLGETLAVDLGLVTVFVAHHSILARASVKRAIARCVPPVVERSTYALVATLAMIAMMVWWRP